MSICLMDMGSDGLDWVPDSSPARRLDPRASLHKSALYVSQVEWFLFVLKQN